MRVPGYVAAHSGDFEMPGADPSPAMVDEASRPVTGIASVRVVAARAAEPPVWDDAVVVALGAGPVELDVTAAARVWSERVYEPLRRRRGLGEAPIAPPDSPFEAARFAE